jgi:hypothetical protein
MMLNGLQTSSKTLPLDTATAKFSSVDDEAIEQVTFGQILKLKEKQLEQEQEASASSVAAAFASLQTSPAGLILPPPGIETRQGTSEIEGSKTSPDSFSQSVPSLTETPNPLSVAHAGITVSNMTKATNSLFNAISNLVNDKALQPPLAKKELPGTVSQTSSLEATTMGAQTSFTTNSSVQSIAVNSPSGLVTETPLTEEDKASDTLPKVNFEPVRSATTVTSKAPFPAIKIPEQLINTQSPIQAGVEEETMKPGAQSVSQTIKSPEISLQSTTASPYAPEIKAGEKTVSLHDPVATRVTGMTVEAESSQRTNDFQYSNIEPSSRNDRQLFESPTTKAPAVSQSIEVEGAYLEVPEDNANISFANSDSSQAKVKENVPDDEAFTEDKSTGSKALPVKIFEDLTTQDLPVKAEAYGTAVEQALTTDIEQRSTSPSPTVSAFSSVTAAAYETMNSNGRLTSQGENPLQSKPLSVHETVKKSDSDPTSASLESAAEPVLTKPYRPFAILNDDTGSEVGMPESKTVELSKDLNSSYGAEIPVDHTSEEGFTVRPDQAASQVDKFQVEQNLFDEASAIEADANQAVQRTSVPASYHSVLSNEQPDDNADPAAQLTGPRRLESVLPELAYVKNTTQPLVRQMDLDASLDKVVPGTDNNFEPNGLKLTPKNDSEIGQSGNVSDFDVPENAVVEANHAALYESKTQEGEAADPATDGKGKSESTQHISMSIQSKNDQSIERELAAPIHGGQASAELDGLANVSTDYSKQEVAASTPEKVVDQAVNAQDAIPSAAANNDAETFHKVSNTLPDKVDAKSRVAAESKILGTEPNLSRTNADFKTGSSDLSYEVKTEVNPDNEIQKKEGLPDGSFAQTVIETDSAIPQIETSSSSVRTALNKFVGIEGQAFSITGSVPDPVELDASEANFSANVSTGDPDQSRAEVENSQENIRHGERMAVEIDDKLPGLYASEPMMVSDKTKPVTTFAQVATSLEPVSETEVYTQQEITYQSQQDLSQDGVSQNGMEKTLAFKPLAISGTGESNGPQDASISESSETIVDTDGTLLVKTVQTAVKGAETKDSEKKFSAETADVVPEQAFTEPAEISAVEINTEKDAAEPNFEREILDAKAIPGDQFTETQPASSEKPDSRIIAAKVNLPEKENHISQSTKMDTGQTIAGLEQVRSQADSTVDINKVASVSEGDALSGTEKTVFLNESSETDRVHVNKSKDISSQTATARTDQADSVFSRIVESLPDMFGEETISSLVGSSNSSDNVSSETTINEDVDAPVVQLGSKTTTEILDEAVSGPELDKANELKNHETPIDVEMLINRLAQNGTKSSHETNSASDVDVNLAQFNASVLQPNEKKNADYSESTNEVGALVNQGTGTVEFVNNQVPAVPSRSQNVEKPGIMGKAKQTSEDEKASPIEKQPKVNQTPGSVTPANGPENEPPYELNGKVSSKAFHVEVKEVVQQVIRHINSNFKNGPTSMHLQLNPGELGAIDVQMVSDLHGVHVTFFPEQASTGKLLETQLDQLRTSLMDSGVHLSGLDIGQHNQSGQKGGSFEQSTNFTRDFSPNFRKVQTGNQENSQLERSLGQSSDIDYLI